MSPKRAILAGLLSLGLATAARAQFEVNPGAQAQRQSAQRLEAGGFIGGMSFSQALGSTSNIYLTASGEAENVDFGSLFGFHAGWAFTRNLAAEFHFATGENAYTFSVDDEELGNVALGEQFVADQLFWSGNVVVQLPLQRGIVPYGTVGFGQLRTTPVNPIGELGNVSTSDVNFGGGVKYWLPPVPWLGIRFDVRFHTASEGLTFPGGSDSPSGTEITIGGTIRLF